MITKLRKIAAAFISLIMLCSCTGNSEPIEHSIKAPAKSSPTGSAESSVFGRSVSYNAYAPAKDLTLPIPSETLTDAVMIDKTLYLLSDGLIFTLDTETGNSSQITDAPASAIATHDGKLYSYSFDDSLISEFDPSGEKTAEIPLKIDGVDSVDGLSVTDNYYVFKCTTVGEVFIDTVLMIYSRETCELTLSKKASTGGIYLYPYKGDKLFSLTVNIVFGNYVLSSFDVETGKSENLCILDGSNRPTAVYSPKTDTALIFGPDSSVSLGYERPSEPSPCSITEYSLSDGDYTVLNRYYLDIAYETEYFLNICENVVTAITTDSDACMVYDYTDPPESITVLGNGSVFPKIIYAFERETGILVKTAYTDFDKLVLKLMAGDGDFDIYDTGSGYHNYVNAGVFVDLKTVESLNSRISRNKAAELIVSLDGKYFGVPTVISQYNSEELFPEDGSSFCYSIVVSENNYYAQNIDVAEGRYDDPSGEELYKLFKYINDNPTGNRKKMPFGDDIKIYTSNVYLLNPKSPNQDNAIRFLEYLYDSFSGEIPGNVSEDSLYPELESTENCYAGWRCMPMDIINPIMNARVTVRGSDEKLSSSELKRLAKEAAGEVAMRMWE